MKPFSLLVKPASADCNLRCEYCFYLEKCGLYPGSTRHRMSQPVLEQMIRTFMSIRQPQHVFGWQGGEPTLMGLDFFKQVVAYQQRFGASGAVVANGLQTNTTMIDDEWARFLSQYHFLIGCSLDGPAEIHNHYRKTIGGEPSHAAVRRGIECLRTAGAEYNILVLVSQANVRRAREVYRYLCEQGERYHQYIPCVEFDATGAPLPFSITGPEWGDFMCAIFDEWYPHDTRSVSVRHFDSMLEFHLTGMRNVCVMGRDCCQYIVVEHNGDLYPCDFFVRPELCLGNIQETTWDAARNHPRYRQFGALKPEWNSACDTCPCLDLCSGDCLKHRLYLENDPRRLSWLCEGWKQFYAHTRSTFAALTAQVRREQQQQAALSQAPTTRQTPSCSPGRNAPCPCGSGRKYKKCCGRR